MAEILLFQNIAGNHFRTVRVLTARYGQYWGSRKKTKTQK